MRRAARVDDNQRQIIDALRKIGATVQPIHQLGKGVPDILVGFRDRNLVLEIKDGKKPPSARKLTEDEFVWHANWKGQVAVVESVEQAIQIVMETA